MDQIIKEKWTGALRSGEYEQGHGLLKGDTKYCCLGVLAVVCGLTISDDDGNNIVVDGKKVGYKPITDMVGNVSTLWYMNDGIQGYEKHTFAEIADYIDKRL